MNEKIENLLTFAQQGAYENYIILGDIYDSGDGVKKDPAKAFEYYSCALLKPEAIEDEGDAWLYVVVGQRLLVGYGCKQNVAEALKYFEIALEHGDELDDEKYNSLAMMTSNIYKYGIGIKKDPAKALSILEKAYSNDHFEGKEPIITEIIKNYLHGEGTEKNTSKALYYFLENSYVETLLMDTDPSLALELLKLVGGTKGYENPFYKNFMRNVSAETTSMERVYINLSSLSEEIERKMDNKPYIDSSTGEVLDD